MEEKLENIKDYANILKHGMFASRPSSKEAMDYAYELIETIDKSDRAAAFTALHVVLNTVANTMEQIIQE